MAPQGLIEELEIAIANKDISRRADALRRVADLFSSGAGTYSGEQVELFDTVMSGLLSQIDTSARAAFGLSVVERDAVPPHTLQALALDDAIDVAGPILSDCRLVSEEVLVEGARSKSQDHLLAISRRRSLTEAVTDVLVERGSHRVVLSTATNRGARFSEIGLSKLTSRAGNDEELALCVWSRPDIPRRHLLKLFAEASSAVRSKMQETAPGKARIIDAMIAQGLERLQSESRDRSPTCAEAEARVRALQQAGQLDEIHLHDFAAANRFEDTVAALKLMCDVPTGVVERAMIDDGTDQVIVLARATGLSWETTRAILKLRMGNRSESREEINRCVETFRKLQPATARKAIQFYRMREQAVSQPTGETA